MISFKMYRIWAITLRYLHQSVRDLLLITDFIFWPMIDIVLWGMSSVWFEKAGLQIPGIVMMTVSALVLWQIVYQANMDITNNLIDEFWSQNLANIFGSPLTINEWISAVMLLGTFRILLLTFFGSVIAWILYALNIFSLGWVLIPFVISLLLSGWCLGFCTAAFIMYGGMRAHWATWAIGAAMSPFIAIYYPVETLPNWCQTIGSILPPTYVFEGMRSVILKGALPWKNLILSLFLNAIYLALSIFFFKRMFQRSRSMGLSRFE